MVRPIGETRPSFDHLNGPVAKNWIHMRGLVPIWIASLSMGMNLEDV
jgi:hypothetical protein